MQKKTKVRLDILLTTRGLFPSREAARRAIMAGLVKSAGEVLDKPGTQVRDSLQIQVTVPEHGYVSRGGLKLERALQSFNFSVSDKVVVDVGASTGGFTDCALQKGAQSVYAVDVGYGQLAWKLREDPRVIVMERTNFRHVDVQLFQPMPSVAVMDVSFISTRLLIPKLRSILQPPCDILSLIKPQFEAGKGKVGKGGIVKDRQIHREVLHDMLVFIYQSGLNCRGLDFSPISGGDGNIEFLAWWSAELQSQESDDVNDWLVRADEVIEEAWLTLSH